MADAVWDPAGDEPVSASKLNNGALFTANNIADLETLNGADLVDGAKYFLDDTGSVYLYSSGSSATPDGFEVLEPADSVGRFLLRNYAPVWTRDTSWISTFPSVDGNNFQYLGTDGAGAVTFFSPADGPQKFTQASHGFAAKDMIRNNGSGSWVKAQGDTIVKCTGTWFVLSVSGDDFVAVKSGRVTLASHGLTAGSLYYLSAGTAGLLTTTKPVGDTTTPLGFFLPAVYVESSSVLHVLGKQYPEIDNLIAEYAHNSGSDTNSITFSNLDVQSYGGALRFVVSMGQPSSGFTYVSVRVNGLTSGYTFTNRYDDGTNYPRFGGAAQAAWNVGYTSSTSSSDQLMLDGIVQMARDTSGAMSIKGQYYTTVSNHCGNFWGVQSGTGNITSLLFGDYSSAGYARFRASQTNFARLYRP